MEISDHILKNALKRVHFIWGDGKTTAAAALKEKYRCYVYRMDPRKWETASVSEMTAMVLCDLITRSGAHRRIVCEGDLDMGLVLPVASHGVFLVNAGESYEVFEGPEQKKVFYEIHTQKSLTVEQWKALEERTRKSGVEPGQKVPKVVPMVTRTDLSTPESVAEEIAQIWGW